MSKPYPAPLPDELAPHHVWLLDCGHNIQVVLAQHLAQAGTDLSNWLVPISVRTVLRLGWTMYLGVPVVSGVPYDDILGAVLPYGETEW